MPALSAETAALPGGGFARTSKVLDECAALADPVSSVLPEPVEVAEGAGSCEAWVLRTEG